MKPGPGELSRRSSRKRRKTHNKVFQMGEQTQEYQEKEEVNTEIIKLIFNRDREKR